MLNFNRFSPLGSFRDTIVLTPTTLIGKSLVMSHSEDNTFNLWKSFKPEVKHIQNRIGDDFFSVIEYPMGYFDSFQPALSFKKWAAIEVNSDQKGMADMDFLHLQGGKYAVFTYKGKASDFRIFAMNIFNEWLPTAGYILDQRPHFTRFGPNHHPMDENAEETFWIPITD
jgi:AraC family transcriptional regulator